MPITHKNDPTPDIKLVVRNQPPPDVYPYEITVYYMKPIAAGTIVRHGRHRFEYDDGTVTNRLSDMQNELMVRAGRGDFDPGAAAKNAASLVIISGAEMVAQGWWRDYCNSHKINMGDIEAITKTYEMTRAEADSLRRMNVKK